MLRKKSLWLGVIKTNILCKTAMKREYFKPAIVVEGIQSQGIICASEYDMIEPDAPNVEAGARGFGHYDYESEEESDNYFGFSFQRKR